VVLQAFNQQDEVSHAYSAFLVELAKSEVYTLARGDGNSLHMIEVRPPRPRS
jgi:hypothetical protein